MTLNNDDVLTSVSERRPESLQDPFETKNDMFSRDLSEMTIFQPGKFYLYKSHKLVFNLQPIGKSYTQKQTTPKK